MMLQSLTLICPRWSKMPVLIWLYLVYLLSKSWNFCKTCLSQVSQDTASCQRAGRFQLPGARCGPRIGSLSLRTEPGGCGLAVTGSDWQLQIEWFQLHSPAPACFNMFQHVSNVVCSVQDMYFLHSSASNSASFNSASSASHSSTFFSICTKASCQLSVRNSNDQAWRACASLPYLAIPKIIVQQTATPPGSQQIMPGRKTHEDGLLNPWCPRCPWRRTIKVHQD